MKPGRRQTGLPEVSATGADGLPPGVAEVFARVDGETGEVTVVVVDIRIVMAAGTGMTLGDGTGSFTFSSDVSAWFLLSSGYT